MLEHPLNVVGGEVDHAEDIVGDLQGQDSQTAKTLTPFSTQPNRRRYQ